MEELETAILNALTEKDKEILKNVFKKEELRISVKLDFRFKMAQSWTKKLKRERENTGHFGNIDLDNLIKNVLDRSNGILFPDDRYVYKIEATKYWDTENKILISIKYD